MRIDAVSIGKNPPEDVNVIVEVPVGGHPIKYEMDKEAGTLVVDRFLYTPMTYPGNYGFVPHTLSEDGDPIDVLIASTRPLDKIAPPDMLARYQIGFDNVKPERASTHNAARAEQFRQAVVRERVRGQFFAEAPAGVEFLGYSLFRVHVPVPAGAPRGQYTAEVYLFKDGVVMSAQSTPLFVDQIGLERRLFNFAHNDAFAYGMATTIMAMLLGYLSSLIFKQT